jgi:hypothetical protein
LLFEGEIEIERRAQGAAVSWAFWGLFLGVLGVLGLFFGLFVGGLGFGEAQGESAQVVVAQREDEGGGEAADEFSVGGGGDEQKRAQAGDLEAIAGDAEGAREIVGEQALEHGGVELDAERRHLDRLAALCVRIVE